MSERIASISRSLKSFPPLFDFVRKMRRLAGYKTAAYQALHGLLGGRRGLRFIQIGANDGMSDDPLREFILKERDWTGVLAEPIPSLSEACRRSYGYYRRGGLHFFNGAVSDRPGRLALWKIREDCSSRFPLFAKGMASADKSHWKKNFPQYQNLDAMLESIDVECVTLRELVSRYEMEDLDLLVMDVEGHEAPILESALRDRVFPRVILFETAHFDPAALLQVEEGFGDHGYCFFNLGVDRLATRDPECQRIMQELGGRRG